MRMGSRLGILVLILSCLNLSPAFADEVVTEPNLVKAYPGENLKVSVQVSLSHADQNKDIVKVTPPESADFKLLDGSQTSSSKAGKSVMTYHYTYNAREEGEGFFDPFVLELQDTAGHITLHKGAEFQIPVVPFWERFAHFFLIPTAGGVILFFWILFANKLKHKRHQKDSAKKMEKKQSDQQKRHVQTYEAVKASKKLLVDGKEGDYLTRIDAELEKYRRETGRDNREFNELMEKVKNSVEQVNYAGVPLTHHEKEMLLRTLDRYFQKSFE